MSQTHTLDLLKIAQEEQHGDLFKLLDSIYKRSSIRPAGHDDAIIWEGGNWAGGVKPVAHAFTDMFALNGTIMALDVLGLPFLGVPMMAQFRHDTKLVSLDWFGKLDYTALKWSTAGDFMVNEGGKKVVVNGKSANAPLRTAAGVYCNVRPYGGITSIRFMPGLPYSQDKKKFKVDPATGIIHSEMNTPGVRMAYAARLFLQMVHETGQIGRVATKPTQAQEDAVNAGIFRWLLQGTKFKLKRQYTVDAYEEHRANVDAIVALLPSDFKHGMEKLVQNSAEENGVWQMMVAASALHNRQEHDLNKLRMENNTLKEKIDGQYATSESRTGALGKRKAEHDADEHAEHATTEDLWGSFAKDCGGF
ncbi:MAG: hypothetical protein RLZZ613_601 [Pseudomonadota bacterium]